MNPDLFAAFVAATAILILIPGPNVLLIVSQSMRFGARAGLLTVAGTSFALAQQLAVTALGLTSVMALMADGFEVIRWAGVAYLLYLGIQAFREKPMDLAEADAQARAPGSAGKRFWQAFFVTWTNPKLLAFYVAFFPQFVDPAMPAEPQLAMMCLAFLAIQMGLDTGYALLAARVRGALTGIRGARIRNRVTGGFLMAAALGLALVRKN